MGRLVSKRARRGETPEHYCLVYVCSIFGKGRHPAALNFGDCMSYAVAKPADQPLLCVGRGFAHTDLSLVRLS